ncbi:hypothetical protein V8C43DRAFT_13674 [Trichoderma afarasin]
MRITLNVFNPHGGDQDSLVTLEVFPDMTVSTLRESVQSEAGIPPTSQHIYHNGRLISDDAKTMEQLQIGDGDMLAVHVRDMRGSTVPPEAAGRPPAAARQQQSAATAAAGAENDTEMLRLQILGDPAVRQQLSRQHPELAAAIEDPARFRRIFLDSQDRERREREMRQREIERLNEDPFNVENQRRIEEMIRQERVMENLQNAMEHNPEGIVWPRSLAVRKCGGQRPQGKGSRRLGSAGNHHVAVVRRGLRHYALGRQEIRRRCSRRRNGYHHWPSSLCPD